MIIDKTTWHYRIWEYWMRLSQTYKSNYQENLCHYVRVLLFWAPLLWLGVQIRRWERFWVRLSHALGCLGTVLVFAAFGLLVLIGIGLLLFSLGGLVFVLITDPLTFLLAMGILAGVIFGCAFTLLIILGGTTLIINVLRDRKPPKIPGTIKLGAAYVVARKRRICPFITFVEEESSV